MWSAAVDRMRREGVVASQMEGLAGWWREREKVTATHPVTWGEGDFL